MTRIFLENYELDLTAEITQQLTFSVDDIRNLDSKTTSFSKTIILPGTQRNNKLLGNIYELSNANFGGASNVFYDFDASKIAQARIEVNGLQAMKGNMRLLSITVDKGTVEYEVALFGELGGFMSALGNKKLEDLDFSKYNHDWDYANITSTFETFDHITADLDYAGPYSSPDGRYDVVYRIEVTGPSILFIQPFDKIRLANSSNDGIYTVAYVAGDKIYVFETLSDLGSDTDADIYIDNQDGYGYVYPLIDYGISDANGSLSKFPNDWDYRTFRPALFVLEYLDNSITNAGYTWESRFLKGNFFRSLIIPNNDIGLEKKGETAYLAANDNLSLDLSGTGTSFSRVGIAFNTIPTNTSFTVSGSDKIFTYNQAGAVTAKIKIGFKGTLNKPFGSLFQLGLFINGALDTTFDIPDPFKEYIGDINSTLEKVISLNNGDVIEVKYIYLSGERVQWISPTNTLSGYWEHTPITEHTIVELDSITLDIINEPPGFIQYSYGEAININNTIPRNVYQKDFFTSIMKLFNLMVVERKDRPKHLVIEPYVEFYDTDRATYLDWSYKVNRDKPMTIRPMSEINARLYDFKFKDDSDYLNDDYKKRFNQTYGNRTFDNQLEFAKDSQSVEVIFSPSVLRGYQDEDKVWPAIYKDNAGVREPMAHNIRIMQIRRIEDVNDWDIYQVDGSGTTSLGTLDKYLYAGHLDNPDNPTIDINWGATKQLYFTLASGSLQNNGFNNFYSPYMAEIIDKDSRLVTCEMKLSEVDIFNLDFSKFIMIDGVLFRLVKIYDWSEGALCKVDLLRVINTTYSIPKKRCTINVDSDDPYIPNANPYFSMCKNYNSLEFPFEFDLLSLKINGYQYANNQSLILNDISELELAFGLDGKLYYSNSTDWINSIIPDSTGVKFYDDFNTIEYPIGTTIEIDIKFFNSTSSDYYYRYNNDGFYIAIDDQYDDLINLGLYNNCINV